jgi:hypothetical protein
MIDITHKRCIEINCQIIPSYNYSGEKKALYCLNHRKENMIDITHKRCIEINCQIIPSYNYSGEKKALYCLKHRKENMINIKDKHCIYCNLTLISNPKYRNHCLNCFVHLFPNEPITRNYKIKEKHVQEYIKKQFPNHDIIYDKPIFGGCSKRRPDLYLDLLTHSIIIEIDENQHNPYPEICENKRIIQLYQDLAHRPIIFIRFNPDSYIINNKKIPSSFKIHKSLGIQIIRNKKEWNNRLHKLNDMIQKYLKNIPEQTIIIEKLFFNEE